MFATRLAGSRAAMRRVIVPGRIRGGESACVGARWGSVAWRSRGMAQTPHSRFFSSTFTQSSSTTSSTSSFPKQPPPPPPPPKKPILIRLPLALALTLLTFTVGFSLSGSTSIPSLLSLANPPTDSESLTLFTPSSPDVAAIEHQITTHPLTQSLLANPTYTASRPHLKIPATLRAQNLTAGTLQGPDKIAVPPLQFSTADGSSFISLQYLGPALCGHPGIVHGGLLATLLDEGLARCCFPALPNKVAVTASLKVEYKKPVMAGQIIVLRAETVRVEGRKAWVRGSLETLDGADVLTVAEALFVEPRQAKHMRRVVT